MRRLGPSALFVSTVAALTVLGVALPASAGQAENVLPSVAADDGDRSSESSGDPGTTRVRRTVRSPIRDPWSAGVRVLWRSLGGKPGGGVALPPTAGGSTPIVLGSCSASGSCSPNSVRHEGGALGTATTGNGLPVQGVAFDAGRLISRGIEVGIGLDLTTHPGQALLSNLPGVGFRNAPPEDTALQVLTGERALQVDLAARLTYRSRGGDPVVRGASLARPYVGIGAGVTRYFPGFSTLGGLGFQQRTTSTFRRSASRRLRSLDPELPDLRRLPRVVREDGADAGRRHPVHAGGESRRRLGGLPHRHRCPLPVLTSRDCDLNRAPAPGSLRRTADRARGGYR